ncbi:MAG: SusC/RagA family TonB-linked outer membrane protein [Bacteroidaceae bacterium]|nr:SusC/RagA family TonB-linked outer membrane protein [Bacteroidaceae bacterium]
MKLKTVGISLLAASLLGLPLCGFAPKAMAETNVMQQDGGVVKGVVKDANGEPVFGAIVFVVGTTNSTQVDFDGNYKLDLVKKGSTICAQMMGYNKQELVWNGGPLNFTLNEETEMLEEFVVTAMGIMRKEKSLTYATQQIKAADLLQVQDVNLVNSLEGKISGITITPSAGGAGGASKITLRGNKSIMGENAPLIVVDGVPMTNGIRGQVGDAANLTYSGTTEGSDPLSMINPDDIESMNILKGANAAALYGSRAANGVVMITTKKGKEGKMEVTFNSNTTFDMPLLTPKLQNSYGGLRTDATGTNFISDGWGDRLGRTGSKFAFDIEGNKAYYPVGTKYQAYLRDYAKDDIAEFYDMGINTNNSISVSGGTEKIQTYISYSNSHSIGMIESNRYNRNTFALRQTYKLWDRITFNVSANYIQTKNKNRVGGGTLGNPIYHLYTTPRDVDMDYYADNYVADGQWWSSGNSEGIGTQTYYMLQDDGTYKRMTDGHILLKGPMQQWAMQAPMYNNPYWLANMNFSETQEDRFSAAFSATVNIIEGLNLQARVSIDHSRYQSESGTYATTWSITDMNRYGRYFLNTDRTNEIYTDYMLSYNKQLNDDWAISATVGYVGHTIRGRYVNTDAVATKNMIGGDDILDAQPSSPLPISDVINRFDPSSGGPGVTTSSNSSNWDQAALGTFQIGWKDKVFVDVSYRHDWYRPFKQFEFMGTDDSYGYFGVGGNAIISDLIELPKWFSYAKYRVSYSEVGNSIPNTLYGKLPKDELTGAVATKGWNFFVPQPEKTKSFETGLEMQFLRDCLNVDITYYNSAMHNSYLEISGTNGKRQPVNSGIIRNQGIELSVGYDWAINKDWRWNTNVNFSYNHNEIEETYKNKYGFSQDMSTGLAEGKIQLRYRKGGSYGDIYITDFARYANDIYIVGYNSELQSDGTSIDVPVYGTEGEGEPVHRKGDLYITSEGKPTLGGYADVSGGNIRVRESNKVFQTSAGNLNSKYQLSWSNTISYKNFSLYFLINGRIGGKVISLTESYLDEMGLSERSGSARLYAEENNIYTADGRHGMYLNDGRDLVAVEDYYNFVGSSYAGDYIYDATNFRLRELSLGYTFRNLFGEYKHLNLSFICRNLFFIYKDAPVDPDVSVSTGNGLGGIDVFNYPSARSFGLNLKLNL